RGRAVSWGSTTPRACSAIQTTDLMAVIGISPCRKLEDYRQSVLHVGGDPQVLDLATPIDQALTGLDGLLLTGGDDVEPSRYGETPHPTPVEAHKGHI